MTALYLILCIYSWLISRVFSSKQSNFTRRKQFNNEAQSIKTYCHYAKKPDWVIYEIIKLKALMPNKGGRKIADHFNRKHAMKSKMTVGKTYVYETLKKHQYEILMLKRSIKHHRPKPLSKNKVWGLDLTTVTDETKHQNTIFGMIDYGTRSCLTLENLKDKSSMTLLTYLYKAMQKYGKPQKIITDNEAVFNSHLFNAGLKLLGIKHQTTDIASPWQNGRIERFFGTFKAKTKQMMFQNNLQLAQSLPEFQTWYNHVRPHSYLDGKTPAEVWNDVDIFSQGYQEEYWFEAWDGLLTGIYFPT